MAFCGLFFVEILIKECYNVRKLTEYRGALLEKRWNFLCDRLDRNQIAKMIKQYRISPVAAVLLLNRGITEDSALKFLKVSEDDFYDPFLMRDMDRAVARIQDAVKNREKITVYGDYDVDGVTSVAMLVRYFSSIGAECDYYIPSRDEEGYGLNKNALEKIAASGTKLIVTVDTGISAIEEVDAANSLGMDVVITDHHTVGEKLPDAVAVVNPKHPDCNYPFSELCGAGVAFKLLCALDGSHSRMLDEYADLAAVAAIADIVPLKNENRLLAVMGIKKIKTRPSTGLAALMSVAGIQGEDITSYQIGFGIAPRINAAGRMSTANIATRLFLEDDPKKAAELAALLNQTNEERRQASEQILKEAIEQIETRRLFDKKVLVLYSGDWHPGIIGITASKIVDLYHKTAILISVENGVGHGSGRSIRGLNLYNAISACSQYMIKFGGHDMAAGFTIDEDRILEFDEAINKYADGVLSPEDMTPKLDIECRLACDGSLLKLADEIHMMEPFGHENPRPLFAIMGCTIKSIRTSRDKKHLFLSVEKNNTEISAVGFGMGDRKEEFSEGGRVNLAATLTRNIYGDKIMPQLRISDIKAV